MHDGARAQEQQRLEQRVVDEMVDRAADSGRGAGRQADGEDPHLRDGVVGQQPFQVILGERHHRAEQRGDQPDGEQQPEHRRAARAVDEEHHPHDRHDAEVDHQAGEERGDRPGRRGVRVREPAVERHQAGLGGEAADEQAERDQVRRRDMAAQRILQLRVVQRPVPGVQQPGAEEDAETRQGSEHKDFERGLQRDRPFQEEPGQSVAGQSRDLEPDEKVEQVRGQRRPDQRGQQQLEQARVTAQLARAETAELGQRVQQQDGADHCRGQREEQPERVSRERDAERVTAHRLPETHVVHEHPAAEDARRIEQQDRGGAAERDQRHDDGQPGG